MFHDGVSTFTLKHGESIRATGLPEGIRYAVSESNHADYTVTASGEDGIIEDGKTVMTLFNNHKEIPHTQMPPTESSKPGNPTDDSPKTGDKTNVALWLALLGISGTAMTTTLAVAKRKHKKRQ